MNGEWTSVKEQLPEIGKLCLLVQSYPSDYIVTSKAKPLPACFICIGGLRSDGKFINVDRQFSDGLNYVSHFMPLPNLPEENK